MRLLEEQVTWVCEVGDMASEGQATGLNGTGFTAGFDKGRNQGWDVGAGDQSWF